MKSRGGFLIALLALLVLAIWLRPRAVFEPWRVEVLQLSPDASLELARSKVADDPEAPGGGVAVSDVDGDGRSEVFWVLRDGAAATWVRNRNLGGRRFEAGVVLGAGAKSAAFVLPAELLSGERGVARGDIDGDGVADLVAAAPAGSETALHVGREEGDFTEVARFSGLTSSGPQPDSWGVNVFDADNDGDLDVFVANGGEPPGGLCELHFNDGRGHFREAGGRLGSAFRTRREHRGSACADLDGDGRLDLVVAVRGAPPLVLWNQLELRHWLRLRLEPLPHENDGAMAGAPPPPLRVEVDVDGQTMVRWKQPPLSPFSAHEATLHFGLGRATHIEALRVMWASGKTDAHGALEGDREYIVRPGAAPRVVSVTAD